MNEQISSWERFTRLHFNDPVGELSLDVSRMNFDDRYFERMREHVSRGLAAMKEIEKGAIANPDEQRMVGHYWLRDPELAPDPEIRSQIMDALAAVQHFASAVHRGEICPVSGKRFRSLLVVGIGGSALGPQFVSSALGSKEDKMSLFFFDNTDPDGMERVLQSIPDLSETLVLIISKSGGTKETRNGQLIVKDALKRAGLVFAKHLVAVTGEGSELDRTASDEGWCSRFPMWDWIGGRTSELSAVGLLPAALQGVEIQKLLDGARHMDELTRSSGIQTNPALLLALMWYHAGCGIGDKDMVVLPYKDRLELFSRYLQQLVMESLGKELDLDGNIVRQGIAVYGNKGSTDQHAYVQQLREGLHNFFAIFIEVLSDAPAKGKALYDSYKLEVESGVTAGDYLSGFFQGTRLALHEKGRESITITIPEVNEFQVGQLIALFERAVGFYASFINVNAYHQPGVEAGKKAATRIIELQHALMAELSASPVSLTAVEWAAKIGREEETEHVFRVLRHLAANGRIGCTPAKRIFDSSYGIVT